jgi:hypothetical protein
LTSSGSTTVSPRATRVDRVGEYVDVRDAILEEVPAACGVASDEGERVVGVDVL